MGRSAAICDETIAPIEWPTSTASATPPPPPPSACAVVGVPAVGSSASASVCTRSTRRAPSFALCSDEYLATSSGRPLRPKPRRSCATAVTPRPASASASGAIKYSHVSAFEPKPWLKWKSSGGRRNSDGATSPRRRST